MENGVNNILWDIIYISHDNINFLQLLIDNYGLKDFYFILFLLKIGLILRMHPNRVII